METPAVGARIEAGTTAEIVSVEPPNAVGNVRCIVRDERGRLGWIIYYPGGTRSNINLFRDDQVEAALEKLQAEG